jgi:hypothetical protein
VLPPSLPAQSTSGRNGGHDSGLFDHHGQAPGLSPQHRPADCTGLRPCMKLSDGRYRLVSPGQQHTGQCLKGERTAWRGISWACLLACWYRSGCGVWVHRTLAITWPQCTMRQEHSLEVAAQVHGNVSPRCRTAGTGISSQVLPSNFLPVDFFLTPPHCLKKKGTWENSH